ncbi:TRAP transporter small permease [Acerihabitans sp.]|uniref:TRAP transporter small permease n=1 Tax=Acerihabitans sp. TaxID=2811394 RepID=UPI002EDB53C7
MPLKYSRLMDGLYAICLLIASIALMIMVTVIPIGIFARYLFDNALSWPEPVAIVCMIIFTFIGAPVGYRANTHISVSIMTDRLSAAGRRVCELACDILMCVICLIMIWYSASLCAAMWDQMMASLPGFSYGEMYLPIPVGSFLMMLFVIERMISGPQDHRPLVMLGNSH